MQTKQQQHQQNILSFRVLNAFFASVRYSPVVHNRLNSFKMWKSLCPTETNSHQSFLLSSAYHIVGFRFTRENLNVAQKREVMLMVYVKSHKFRKSIKSPKSGTNFIASIININVV